MHLFLFYSTKIIRVGHRFKHSRNYELLPSRPVGPSDKHDQFRSWGREGHRHRLGMTCLFFITSHWSTTRNYWMPVANTLTTNKYSWRNHLLSAPHLHLWRFSSKSCRSNLRSRIWTLTGAVCFSLASIYCTHRRWLKPLGTLVRRWLLH